MPAEIACIQTDRGEEAPWGFLAGIELLIPEARVDTAGARRAKRNDRAFRTGRHMKQHTDVHGIHVERASIRIVRCPAPVRATIGAGKQQCGLQADGGEDIGGNRALEQLGAIGARFRRDVRHRRDRQSARVFRQTVVRFMTRADDR